MPGWLRNRNLVWELLFAALAVLSVLPLWVVDRPPLQDLPQHLAAIAVFVDYGDPEFGFSRWFELSLGSTQYLAYYLVAWALAHVFGVLLANKLLMTAAVAGTPYALRALLRALGRDERLALFAFPLAWNAHLILGFINFVAAIPLAIGGLALAVRLREAFTRGRAIALGVVAVLCFYTHVVPFGFLGLGAMLVSLGGDWRATLWRWVPLVPAGIAALVWTQTTPAGQSTLTAALLSDDAAGPEPQFAPWLQSVRQAPDWLTDVLHDPLDERLLVLWALLVLLAVALGVGPRPNEPAPSPGDALRGRLARRLGLLAPLAAFAYFVAPTSYDWIWPINARFPLLALLFLIPVLPAPRRWPALAVYGGVVAISVAGFLAVTQAFEAFEEDEVGQLDEAIAAIPKGSKVAGLIWDRGSRQVKFSPFIHSVAWAQVERGGAVMFTFADFPQSPITFRETDRPPRVPPRWEWTPERVDPARDLDWYDHVLVRGGPGRIASQRETWEPVFRSPRWSVWRRKGTP